MELFGLQRFNNWGDAGSAFCFIHLLQFLFSFKLGIDKASSQDETLWQAGPA